MKILTLLAALLIQDVALELFQDVDVKPEFVSYKEAYDKYVADDAPEQGDVLIVVQLSAVSCRPCQQQRATILNNKFKRGIVWVYLDKDREPTNARSVAPGFTTIPTTVFYRRTKGKWRRREVVGIMSLELLRKWVKK